MKEWAFTDRGHELGNVAQSVLNFWLTVGSRECGHERCRAFDASWSDAVGKLVPGVDQCVELVGDELVLSLRSRRTRDIGVTFSRRALSLERIGKFIGMFWVTPTTPFWRRGCRLSFCTHDIHVTLCGRCQ